MYELTKQDFENILAFSQAINQDYNNFENTVLQALASCFNMRLTAYVACRRDGHGGLLVDQVFSNCLSKDLTDKYKSRYFRGDPFIQRYFQLCFAHSSMTYLTDELLPRDEYENSPYTKKLRQFGVAHEALIGVNGPSENLIHIVRFCKSVYDGDFTEEERALLQYIGQIFNNSKTVYMQNANRLRKLEAVSAYWDSLPFGFAILDTGGQLIQCNSAFMASLPKLSSRFTKDEVIMDVILTLTGTNKLPDDNYFHIETHKNGLKLTLEKKRIEYPSLRAENMFFLTVYTEDSMETNLTDTIDLEDTFGLTRREREIVLLMAKGHVNQEIADELFLSLSTVKSHISNIYGKLGVSTRKEAMKKLRGLSAADR